MYVKPADRKIEGVQLVVRDPDLHDLIPADGRLVPDSQYWYCRLRDGDVVLAEPPRANVMTLSEAAAEEGFSRTD